MQDNLKQLLETVAKGELSPAQALEELKYLHYESVGDFAKIDHHRTLRTGFPEVIFGLGKTPEQIVQIMRVMESKNPLVMATKISAAVYAQIQPSLRGLRYFPLAQICCLGICRCYSSSGGRQSITKSGIPKSMVNYATTGVTRIKARELCLSPILCVTLKL